MKRKLALLLVAFVATAAYAQTATPGGGAPVPANAPAPTKVGIINIQAAIVQSNEGQRDFGALSQKFAPTEAKLKEMSTEVDKLKNEISAQERTLSPEALAAKNRELQQKQTALQRAFEDAQADFQAQQNDLAQRIGQKLIQTLDKYARDNGYAVILDVSNPQTPVLWAVPTVNITEEVINQYNTESGVPAPANAGAPAAPSTTRPAGASSPPATRPAAPGTAGSTRPAPPQQRPPR
jgi:outer membrane protein